MKRKTSLRRLRMVESYYLLGRLLSQNPDRDRGHRNVFENNKAKHACDYDNNSEQMTERSNIGGLKVTQYSPHVHGEMEVD